MIYLLPFACNRLGELELSCTAKLSAPIAIISDNGMLCLTRNDVKFQYNHSAGKATQGKWIYIRLRNDQHVKEISRDVTNVVHM